MAEQEVRVINISERLSSFDDTWVPKVVGELNGQYVKVVKFAGEYVWHNHAEQDELFLVIKGRMELHLRDSVLTLNPGEFVIVPMGVEHKPVAESLCEAVLFEPVSTRNTGNVDHEYTIEPTDLEDIG